MLMSQVLFRCLQAGSFMHVPLSWCYGTGAASLLQENDLPAYVGYADLKG